ncbi:MAG: transposase [Bacteroidetes bacterium]|nr:transposase [Bacteroidota bacterium]
MKEEEPKNIVIHSLEHLSKTEKIDVFAFVTMPNHIHLIWRINEMNGKETAQGSFLKFTAHEFKKMLMRTDANVLQSYAVDAHNKKYEFWQRDSLAVHLFTKEVAFQKLDYIHLNPLAEHWQLAKDPCDYPYSTAKFYEKGITEYTFVKDWWNDF